MSNLLEQASLVMIPSGYAEDIVYSEIPLDGSGDLQFTRASNGTRVNSAGLVEVCPWNLQTYSEDFTNAKYTVNQSSISANATTAPNGTTTADKLVENTANDQHFVYFTSQQIANNETRISVYAKAGGRTNLLMWESAITNAQCLFNLSTGVVTSSSSGNSANLSTTVGQIEDAGNGWYRCSFNYSTASGGGTIRLQLYTTTTSYTGDGTSGIFIWGLQENIGSTAKPYFPTTDRLNVPRLTYQNGGGGCPSLLLEKQSTNIVPYSEQLDNASWTKTYMSVTANATTSPDGTQNADTIANTGTSNTPEFYQLVSGTAIPYTISAYFKANTHTKALLRCYNGGTTTTPMATFNLSSGAVINTYGDATNATIVSIGNGWYRCSMTFTSVSTSLYPQIQNLADSATFDSGYNYFYNYTTTGSVYAWGAQLEASSYATSYIPTTSSSATRVADACFKTGISSLIGQTQGVIFVQGSRFALDSVKSALFAALENTSTGATIRIQYSQSLNILYADVFDGTSFSAQLQGPFIAVGQTFKAALAYKNNDFAFVVNGSVVATDTSGSVPATNDLKINTSIYGNLDGGLQESQLALFKTRLTNAELQSLTTL